MEMRGDDRSRRRLDRDARTRIRYEEAAGAAPENCVVEMMSDIEHDAVLRPVNLS